MIIFNKEIHSVDRIGLVSDASFGSGDRAPPKALRVKKRKTALLPNEVFRRIPRSAAGKSLQGLLFLY